MEKNRKKRIELLFLVSLFKFKGTIYMFTLTTIYSASDNIQKSDFYIRGRFWYRY